MNPFFLLYFPLVALAGSWISCPSSFNNDYRRGANKHKPCETPTLGFPITFVHPGDRLKVGWPSNNQEGGLVRLALVPSELEDSEEAFQSNILKFTCFGQSNGISPLDSSGVCFHPCDARPACSYQSNTQDVNGYDTTIKIPFNLPSGRYTLQWAAMVGNDPEPFYSCAKLQVLENGFQETNCSESRGMMTFVQAQNLKCSRASLTKDLFKPLTSGTKFGNFCYSKNSTSPGMIDDDIQVAPINMNCDPRTSCELSALPYNVCSQIIQGIANPNNPVVNSCPFGSTNTSTQLRTQTPPIQCSPAILAGSKCTFEDGFSMCSGSNYVQCIEGIWQNRSCPQGQICNPLEPGAGFVNCRPFRPGFDLCPPSS